MIPEHFALCKGILISESWKCWLWNPESWALESEI